MAARIPVFLSNTSASNMIPQTGATVKLYQYDSAQPNNRGALVGTFSEAPAGSGSYYLDIPETIKGVVTVDTGSGENNLEGYDGAMFRSDENL